MKKHISFQLIVLIALSNTFYVHSMEKESTPDNVCYLAFLPPELWNYIAQFFLWETEQEFVARTTKEKDEEFPEKYYEYFFDDISCEKKKVCGAFSPDKSKIALHDGLVHMCYDHNCNTCKPLKLVIVDLQQPEEDKVLSIVYLDKSYHRAIGISSSGTMFAGIKKEKIKKEEDVCVELDHKYSDLLIINKITEKGEIVRAENSSKNFRLMTVVKEKYIFNIPDSFYISYVMFNKQETSVIAHGRDFRSDPMQKSYLLFELKNDEKENNIAYEKAVVENKGEKNWLLDYFRRKCVCMTIKGIEK